MIFNELSITIYWGIHFQIKYVIYFLIQERHDYNSFRLEKIEERKLNNKSTSVYSMHCS